MRSPNTSKRRLAPACLIAIAALGVLGAGCQLPGNDTAIRLTYVQPLKTGPSDEGCEVIDGYQQTRGTLDISAVGFYLARFAVESNLQATTTSVNEQVLDGPEKNDFIATEQVLTYSSTPQQSFESESLPLYYIVAPGTEGDEAPVTLNLVGPKAAQTLQTVVAPGDELELRVTVELRGKLASGSPLRSNQVTFPILIFNSGFQECAPGDFRAPTGPCGFPGGQDGTIPGCCSNPFFADVCSG